MWPPRSAGPADRSRGSISSSTARPPGRRAACRRRCRRRSSRRRRPSPTLVRARPTSARPPAIDLATAIRSGWMPDCSIANSLPVRPNPVCTSSAISTMPCSSAISRRPAPRPPAHTKPPSPCTGSKMMAATLRRDVRVNISRSSSRPLAPVPPPSAVGYGYARGRPRARTDRARPCRAAALRSATSPSGAPVEGALEGDDRRAAGGQLGELDGVLDGLGAGVEERGLLSGRRSAFAHQPLGELDVRARTARS